MNLSEARELRQELEVIEATMLRIKELWLSNDFPSPDWMARVRGTAEHRGISMADFIIMAVNERLTDAPTPESPPAKKAKKAKKRKGSS